MRAWDLATRTPWAIDADALRTILEIAARENLSPDAVAAQLGRDLDNTRRVTVRDGVAIVPVVGPLFRYANLFTSISGATSYAMLASDFTEALASEEVSAILLDIDSPGGEVNGCAELCDLIYAARGAKPITAYVGGSGASGAYWLASAADEVVTGDTALLGSIGVVAVFYDTTEAERKAGVREIEIVSSQSPRKRPDPAEDEGRAQLQATIDDLAGVFIAAVARNRGVSVETVLAEFGKGDVFVGQKAVAAGLADRTGSFEGVLAELAKRAAPDRGAPAGGGFFQSSQGGTTMADQTNATPAADNQPANITVEQITANHPQIATHFRAEGASAERTRILGIEANALPGHEALVAQCKADGSCSPDQAASQILQAERSARTQQVAAIKADEGALDAPKPSVATEQNPEAAEADRMLQAAGITPKNR